MKYVCHTPCQIRNKDNKIITVSTGEVVELDAPHKLFRAIEGEGSKIDFETASEEELLEAEYPLKDLKEYILKTYGKHARNRNREHTVELLLDCRFRKIGKGDGVL